MVETAGTLLTSAVLGEVDTLGIVMVVAATDGSLGPGIMAEATGQRYRKNKVSSAFFAPMTEMKLKDMLLSF
ncbi:hypothetical protein Tco_0370695 [Tanacetum coccineum]